MEVIKDYSESKKVAGQGSFTGYIYKVWHNLMGNYFTRQPESKSPLDKCNDARSKIAQAREKYLKKLLKDEKISNGVAGDELDGKPKVPRKKPLKSMPSILNDIEVQAMKINPKEYDYPFENLVFEGGGNKGLAYCGAVKLLEQLGIFPQIKRFAGTSAGAMTAALLAVGYNSNEIEESLSQDLSRIFLDASFGIFSLLPNLLTGYGWNPGNRIFQWFGEALAKKSNGNPDITFLELYEKTGRELCIVVTNLNHMIEEYCHVKTTPNMPIRLAVRMSMSIPGMFQATNYTENGETNTYVDGGVLCNFPIHCYDGWWLSMRQGDNFLERLQPLDQIPQLLDRRYRFKYDPDSNKTLGLLLYADSESDVFRYILERRIGVHLDKFPNTKLAKKKLEKKNVQEKAKREHRRVTMAVDVFLKVLKKHNLDKDDKIDRTELDNAFKDMKPGGITEDEFTTEHANLLFGENCNAATAFEALDKDGNGEIQYHELVNFIQSTGICLQQRFLGYQRKDITGLFSFFDTLQNALLTNVKRVFVEERDFDRTVGINTGHVGTSDFVLEPEDRAYVVEQGRRSMESFLKYYAALYKLKKKTESISEDPGSENEEIDAPDDEKRPLNET
ncbi:uncharacterized protein [Mytilus edulis]|uniref:uncharacterized protein isoform X3 n=1 Tax=Mytilus edulis TaxID=6550 RepID=UPI0039F09675